MRRARRLIDRADSGHPPKTKSAPKSATLVKKVPRARGRNQDSLSHPVGNVKWEQEYRRNPEESVAALTIAEAVGTKNWAVVAEILRKSTSGRSDPRSGGAFSTPRVSLGWSSPTMRRCGSQKELSAPREEAVICLP